MNSSWILSLKFLLISAAVVSLAVGLRFSLPIAADGIPATWSFILSWLKPPYLYLIINGIIITIAASSRFHHSQSESSNSASSPPPPQSFESFPAHPVVSTAMEEPISASEIDDAIVVTTTNGPKVDIDIDWEEKTVAEEAEDRDVFVDWALKQTITPPPQPEEELISPELQLESQFPVREKPLAMSRFGHRKPNRTMGEGVRALRVARAKKHETLESTWKMITEGRHVPLNRHLKKTDTWEQAADPAVESEERGNHAASARARIGKEASLGQEELNRRVEAFIKKFNEEMKMQRQESLNQFMEMINRGV